MSETEGAFAMGIMVSTVHMAKGLEFDEVFVAQVEAKTYHRPMDRALLYVACTRAMHRLMLFHTGARSDFLPSDDA